MFCTGRQGGSWRSGRSGLGGGFGGGGLLVEGGVGGVASLGVGVSEGLELVSLVWAFLYRGGSMEEMGSCLGEVVVG